MIKKYYTGGPWEDVLGDDYSNSSNYINLSNPNAKLSKPGGINLNNLYDNLKIKLKKDKPGFIESHPYLADTVRGAVSGATMLLNNQSQRQMKKAQRDYVNDPFNLYDTSAMKKYGSRPWLDSTAQFTDFPNEKVPVFEPGYQNSAYINPMATAKKGGQLYMTFQGGGATNQLGAGSSLPKYEMGAGSPVQQALLRDNEHFGLPMAKGGGFFTPDALTAGTENEELYNKPNNFLNYLRDMSANTVVQNALGRKRKGQLTEEEEMGMAQMGMQAPQQAAPQQGGGQEDQIIQMVAQALQQGASPEEVMQKLVEIGVPEEQAMQIVQMVSEQMQGGQQQAPEQMPQEMSQEMAQGMPQEMGQQMPMAQMGMGGGGGDFEEFGFDTQNPLNPYYQNLYDPSEAKQVNASLVEGLYNAGQDLFSQPIAGAKRRQADTQAKLQELQKYITPQAMYGGMTRYQKKAIVKPTATDAAGFEKWYNETMADMMSDPNVKPEDIQAFMNMAGNWASDIKVDRNQLQYQVQNPLTYETKYTVPNESGVGSYIGNRKTRDKQSEYEKEYLDILKKFDTDYEVAAAKNQIKSSKNPNADSKYLTDLEIARDNALQALETKYPTKAATDQDFFYSKPGTPAANATTTPGANTTPGTTTTGPGGYQFNPAMQQLLGAMAAGYTKTPLFGFRTNRNINALFNQTMADMMLKSQGQGQGTASAPGAGVPGVPAMGPNGAANTWFKDNNINRYDITQNPNKFKMRIRANQPGQGAVQYDANGNLITPGGESFISKARNRWDVAQGSSLNPVNAKLENSAQLSRQFNPEGYRDKSYMSDFRNDAATDRLTNMGNKIDRLYQKEKSLGDWYNTGLSRRGERQQNRLEERYNDLAQKFGRNEYKNPALATKGSFEMGGQYKEGGTYYLSDEEIQALISAGYELE